MSHDTTVVIGQWNMLTSNMAYGEFLSNNDERNFLLWAIRGPKVMQVIQNMFTEQKCDFVVVVENDKSWEILESLRNTTPTMGGVAVVDQSKREAHNNSAWIGGTRSTLGEIQTTWKNQYGDEKESEAKNRIALGKMRGTKSHSTIRETIHT